MNSRGARKGAVELRFMEALVSARHYAMSFTQILPFNSYNSPEKSKKFKQHLTSIRIHSVPDVALNVLPVSFLS